MKLASNLVIYNDVLGLINTNTVLQINKIQEEDLGISLSIILHAIFVCILVSLKHSSPPTTMPEQYVEVANLTLKPYLKSDIYSNPSHLADITPVIPNIEKPRPRPEESLKAKQVQKSVSQSSNTDSVPFIGDAESGADQSAGSSEFGTGPTGGGLGAGDGAGKDVVSGDGLGSEDGIHNGSLSPEGHDEGSIGLGDSGFWNEYGSKLQIICNRYKHYPPTAAQRGWQGTSEILIHFFPDGKTINVTITSSAGKKVLDEQALYMVQKGLAELPLPSNYEGRDIKLILLIDFKLE